MPDLKPSVLYERQDDVFFSQDDPVANTLYTVLDTTKRVRIHSVSTRVTWTVQPTPLEVIITIDGKTINHNFTNPVSLSNYSLQRSTASEFGAELQQLLIATFTAAVQPHPGYEGRTIKVEVRTGATTAGTVSNLACRVKWSKIP